MFAESAGHKYREAATAGFLAPACKGFVPGLWPKGVEIIDDQSGGERG